MPPTHIPEKLGDVEGNPIWLISPAKPDPMFKSVLIVAGFHGEEIAGPWGLCRFICTGGLSFPGVNVSVIPVVNPDGFSRGKRYNRWNEVSNHFFNDLSKVSREGKILLAHIDRLLPAAKDGFLSLHENEDLNSYYFYYTSRAYNKGFSDLMIGTALKRFDIRKDGQYHSQYEGNYVVKDGCVFNHKDDSFDQFLFDRGVPLAVTSETPMKADFEDRVEADNEISRAFLTAVARRASEEPGDWAGRFFAAGNDVSKSLAFDRDNAWGYLLSMDLTECELGNISDYFTVAHYPRAVCDLIGSTPIGEPLVTKFGEGELFGYSLAQLISTSSITGHFIEKKREAYVDVFYCKMFDPGRVAALTKGYFGAKSIKMGLMTRGLK